MLKLLLLELLWHICTSLLISIADKDRHHLQFTNEIIKPQKLAQGNRAIRNAHVFESFSAWFQSPFYSIASGLDRVFPSQKWLIVWRERRRKKLNTEDKRITGVKLGAADVLHPTCISIFFSKNQKINEQKNPEDPQFVFQACNLLCVAMSFKGDWLYLNPV